MILRPIILFALAVGFIVYTIAFVRKGKTVQKQWMYAFRHIVALIAGWVAFGVLSGVLVLLDLLETNTFSLTAFANALVVPLIIFIGGMILLRMSLGRLS